MRVPNTFASGLACLLPARVQDIKFDVVQHIASRGDRNWWRRRWVVQEAAVATSEPVLLLGNLWLPWGAFDNHLISLTMGIMSSDTDVETAKEAFTFATIRCIRTLFRKPPRLGTFNLSYLLWQTVDLYASDPHDAIYAVLGLVDDETKQAVRVDYGMSVIDLYADITQLLVGAPSLGSDFPLDVVIGGCWQRSSWPEPSWILDFSQRSTHSESWGEFDNRTMLPGPKNKLAKLRDLDRTVCDGHVIVGNGNNNELKASFDKNPRKMTVSGFVLGVISNIIQVRNHLLSLKTKNRPAVVDESAIRIKLQCTETRLAAAFSKHSQHRCPVDQSAIFITTDGDIGMCYSTMNNGRPGLDASSPVLKAGDKVACVYGASSPVLIRMPAGGPGKSSCLLLPCMFMKECECYMGEPHPVEAFERMSFA